LDSAPTDNYVFGSDVKLQYPQPETFYAYLLKKNITTIIDYAIKNRYVALWETNTDDDNAMHNPNFINILDDLNFNIHDYKYQLQAIKVDHMEVEEYYRNYQSYLVRFAELNPPPQPRTFSWNDQFPEPLPE
ncbi:MAG: hypothetical protein NT128_02185, partial [Proteobacteria bacterium]|nr:hypothetical protein [Pseudomonadota bacterium]